MAARGWGRAYQGMNWIWGPTRYAIYVRDGFRCVWCYRKVSVGADEGEVRGCLDHLQPVHEGGSHKPQNLVTACADCNRLRGPTSYEAWCDSAQWNPVVDLHIAEVSGRPLTAEERALGRELWRTRERCEGGQQAFNWRNPYGPA